MTRRRAPAAFVACAALATGIAASTVAGGCGSAFHPADATGDASASEAGTSFDAPTTDAPASGGDGSTCGADLSSDGKNCGRCGHDCLGAGCSGGHCDAVEMASVGARLSRVLLVGSTLYAASAAFGRSGLEGIWRIPTAGGAAESFVANLNIGSMAELNGTLYFVVYDDTAADGGTGQGGLYSCTTGSAAPCIPTLIAPAVDAFVIAVDSGHVFYTDGTTTGSSALMRYTPPGPPVVVSNDGVFSGLSDNLYVDGDQAFVSTTLNTFPLQQAELFGATLGGADEVLAKYNSKTATSARVFGSKDAVYFTAYDAKTTTGGFVHRVPRDGGAPCDFGGSQVARPYGVHADETNVYWVNQGVGDDVPFKGSTVAACPVTGCCINAQVLWTGDGQATDLTGDDRALYFVGDTDGSIWKLAKP